MGGEPALNRQSSSGPANERRGGTATPEASATPPQYRDHHGPVARREGLGSPRTLRGQATRSPNGRQTWLKGYVVRRSAIRSRVSRDRRSRVGIASPSNTTPNEPVRILADDNALVRSKACSSQMSDLKLKEYRMASGAVGGMKGDRHECRRGKPFYRPPRLHSKAG